MNKLTRFFIFLVVCLPLFMFVAWSMMDGAVARDTTGDHVIYDNSLREGWDNWSWSSSVNFSSTKDPYSGNHAIEYISHSWGGLYFHTSEPVDSTKYENVEISIKASQEDAQYVIFVYDHTNNPVQFPIPLEQFGGNPPVNSWKTYTIPLNTINPSGKPFSGISLHENSGKSDARLYVDEVILRKNQNALSAEEYPSHAVYTNFLEETWENWSWGSLVHFDTTFPVYTGSKSISFTTHTPWAGLYLHAKESVDTTSFETLQFSVYATEESQTFSVVLHDEYNTILGNPVKLETFGALLKGQWTRYSIPLTVLNGKKKRVSGIVFQETKGHGQPTIYIDDISFTSSVGSNQKQLITPTQSPTISQENPINGTPSSPDIRNPLSGMRLYVNPKNNAQKTADTWRNAGREADANQIMKIGNNPTAFWAVGGDSLSSVSDYVTKAEENGSIPVIVSYNIPGRDCGQHSTGGSTYETYKSWISNVADTIGDRKSVVILEPDALGLDCLQNENTYSLLRHAVDVLEAKSQTDVYIEASTWVDHETLATRLRQSGIANAQGFAVNTSGFQMTDAMKKYGVALSEKIGGKHFVIDTSRNGHGPYEGSDQESWCNPPERSLGLFPTTDTGHALVDAYLWIKVPGESDGTCRGGPRAGEWWAEYALGLAQRSQY